ncbi:MAG TPA: alpha/beta fold hydrolase [Stellaceae bacterium]|nr:alpha/beta fold hydrolase [Stellaceae bacterium]
MDEARVKTPADLGIAPFAPRAPWWGADLQTLSNYLRPRASLDAYAQERLVLPLGDGSGDRLSAALNHPASGGEGRPLVVLIHGLGGDEDSTYMRRSAANLLARGYNVLRVNLRGAGPSRQLSRFQYHAGRTEDFALALAALPAALTAHGIAAVGYSLGGNMLLKFLGERGGAAPVRAAVSVSAPIDLAATSRRMLRLRNFAYQSYLMRNIRQEAVAPISDLSAAERRAVLTARTIWAFDEAFSAPRNGFAGAEDYYARNSARRFLGGIRVPTLVIHALDDPWVPGYAYVMHDWGGNRHLLPLLASGGGHVGFQGRDRRVPWSDLAIARFLETSFSPP